MAACGKGGAAICRDAGIPIAGGHSIDVPEPIDGLVGLGLVHPDRVPRNADAKAGDMLILGKPLGVGVLSAALKQGVLGAEGCAEMLRHTTQLNRVGIALAQLDGVHALTDVTGYGLAGHLLEICRGSGLSARVQLAQMPLIPSAVAFAQQGIVKGASKRNWAADGHGVQWPSSAPDWQPALLTDPQTRGGLLVSCSAEPAELVLEAFRSAGFDSAAVVGQIQGSAGEEGVSLACF